MPSGLRFLPHLLLLLAAAAAFSPASVPASDSNHKYRAHETVTLWVNKVGPYNNPQETYNYYSLPFCELSENPAHRWGGLGEVLGGNELIDSQIEIKFLSFVEKTDSNNENKHYLFTHNDISAKYNDNKYRADEAVTLWVNKVGPYNNPQETYNYYSLPFCKLSENPAHRWGGLGEVLGGNELIDSQIEIKFLKNVHRASICTLGLDASKVQQFTDAIENLYWFEYFIDDLPSWDDLPLWGFVEKTDSNNENKHYLFTHNDNKYRVDEAVTLWVNKVGPYNNPQETYNYYSLLFCKLSETPAHRWGGLGEVLGGNVPIDSQIKIKFLENVHRASICTLRLDASKVQQFTDAIENSYWFEFFIDDLPLWGFVGKTDSNNENKHYLFTHNNNKYHADEAVAPWVNKVGPYNNPQETYNYYSLPFCKLSDTPAHRWGGLGEVLGGNVRIDSQIKIKFLKNVHRASICTLRLDASKVQQFTDAIENSYWFEFFIDDLPLWENVHRASICTLELDASKVQQFTDAIENSYCFEFFIDDLPLWGFVGKLCIDGWLFVVIILLKGGLRIHRWLFFLTIAATTICTTAVLHEVGGTDGWTVPPNSDFYIIWARESSFVLGDLLHFSYKGGNLCVVQKSSYLTCNATNRLMTFYGGSTYFELFETQYYFISSNVNNCMRGQRLAIRAQSVYAPSASPPSSPPPPPLPSPLSPPPPPPPAASSGSDSGTAIGGTLLEV